MSRISLNKQREAPGFLSSRPAKNSLKSVRDSADANNWKQFLAAARGFSELGMFAEAAQELEKIPGSFKIHREVMAFRVLALLQTSQWKEAISLAQECAKNEPRNSSWQIAIAFATLRIKSPKAALTVMKNALKHHPYDYLVNFYCAVYAAKCGKLDEARGALSNAFRLNAAATVSMAMEEEDLALIREACMVRENTFCSASQ